MFWSVVGIEKRIPPRKQVDRYINVYAHGGARTLTKRGEIEKTEKFGKVYTDSVV